MGSLSIGKIVPHEERLVLIDGQPAEGLVGIEGDVDATLFDAMSPNHLADALEESDARVTEIHRVDGMSGNRHRKLEAADRLLAVVGQSGGVALAHTVLVNPVQVDEMSRGMGAVGVCDTVLESRADESQMRIGVLGLGLALIVAQLIS